MWLVAPFTLQPCQHRLRYEQHFGRLVTIASVLCF